MRARRVYSPLPLAGRETLALRGAPARHVVRVLRLRCGDELVLFDGLGGEYTAHLTHTGPDRIELRLGSHLAAETESSLELTLIQAIARGGRMDWCLQKATELGVVRFVPVLTERTVVRLDASRAAGRLEHWKAVAASACEQCGRNRLPVIAPPQQLQECLDEMRDAGPGIVLHRDRGCRLTDIDAPRAGLALLVGPEGGLSEAEFGAACAAGFRPVNLGPRILRTETAALAALSIAQALWGD